MDEVRQHILEFVNGEEKDRGYIAEQGKVIVNMITRRLGDIHNAEGLTDFFLGGVIKKLRQDKAWELFDGVQQTWVFGDFAKNVLGMSQGKAMGLLRVWEKSQQVQMTPDEVEEVGWAVADKILRFGKSRSDIDNLLERYRAAKNPSQFIESLKENPPEDGKPKRTPKKKVVVKVDETEEQFLQESLERAAEKMGKELNKDCSPEAALMFITTEWRQYQSRTE